jgi:hypothetical protein
MLTSMKRSSAAFALVAAVGLQMMCTKLDIPVTKIARNVFSSATPPPVEAKHCPVYTCADGALAKELTVVVTVKDACSQMPGFVKALEDVVGTDTARPPAPACDARPRARGSGRAARGTEEPTRRAPPRRSS